MEQSPSASLELTDTASSSTDRMATPNTSEAKPETAVAVSTGDDDDDDDMADGADGDGDGFQMNMSRADKRKLKKKRKQLDKGTISATGSDYSLFYGTNGEASLELKLSDYFTTGRKSLHARELQQLIAWVLHEDSSPKWIFVKNKPLVQQVILLVVDGMTSESIVTNPEGFQSSFEQFISPTPQPIPLHTSHSAFNRSSVLADYLSCPIARDKEKEKEEKRQRARLERMGSQNVQIASAAALEQSKKELEHLHSCLLNLEEMKQHGYPLPAAADATQFRRTCSQWNCLANQEPVCPSASAMKTSTLEDDWVQFPCVHGPRNNNETPSSDPATTTSEVAATVSSDESSSKTNGESSTEKPHMFGIDCEMCYTAEGLELTRATLINSKGDILLDEFVLPSRPIVDYNTRYSGVTPEMLKGVTLTLESLREKLHAFIKSHDILVGHSLENDLKALKLAHRYCLDTAVLYTHPRGPPFKNSLRFLSQKHLQRAIQGSSKGHDSKEDALAALDLAHLKVKHGRKFGEPQSDRESLAKVLQRSQRKVALIGPAQCLRQLVNDEPLYSAQIKELHEEVIDSVCKEAKNVNMSLVIAAVTVLREGIAKPTPSPSSSPAPNKETDMEAEEKKMVLEPSSSSALAAPSPSPSPVASASPSASPSPSTSPPSSSSATTPPSSSPGPQLSLESLARFRAGLQQVVHTARPNTLILVASGQGLGYAQPQAENNKAGVLWLMIKGHQQSTSQSTPPTKQELNGVNTEDDSEQVKKKQKVSN